jgi:hypothetical protein
MPLARWNRILKKKKKKLIERLQRRTPSVLNTA